MEVASRCENCSHSYISKQGVLHNSRFILHPMCCLHFEWCMKCRAFALRFSKNVREAKQFAWNFEQNTINDNKLCANGGSALMKWWTTCSQMPCRWKFPASVIEVNLFEYACVDFCSARSDVAQLCYGMEGSAVRVSREYLPESKEMCSRKSLSE